MAKLSTISTPSLTFDEGAAASTPAAADVVVYAKSDGRMYSKDDAGNETLMSSGIATVNSSPPTFVAAGTSATGTGAVVPGLPAGHIADDILLLFVQSDNEAVAAPAGYVKVGPAAGIGTAAAALATRLTVFWKRDGGSEADPTVADTGDHTLAQIIAIRGCPTSGDPFRCVGATKKTTASTTGTGSAGATPTDNCLVVQAFAHSLDSASAVFSSWTNASLSSVTERIDVATADGNGGGIGVATGLLAVAGPFVATTVTETSTVDVGTTFFLLPEQYLNKGQHIDRQVFLSPGTDTWTKPSGALVVRMRQVGAGASGSAGRNAATAAGGGGGGGGAWSEFEYLAADLAATLTVTAGTGGPATAHVDGTASTAGTASQVAAATIIAFAAGGGAASASGSGAGGNGGNGGGAGTVAAAGLDTFGVQPTAGGVGATTAAAGSAARDFAGSAGAGGGTTQATSAGGSAYRGGAGGGGGRSNTNVGTGGAAGLGTQLAGGATASANGADSPYLGFGGSGAAGGTSASGTGGNGGWPGGGGGGGGSQSGAQGGGKGGDGVVIVTTFC